MTVAQPLTERILGRLPGPQAAWIAAWALVPWLNAGVNLLLDADGTSAVWEQSRALLLLNYAFLSLAVAITLWGTGRIARRVAALDPGAGDHFRELNGVVGPLLLAGAGAVAFGVTAFVRDGWASALLRGGTWFVLGTALWTFLWTYGSLHLGLDRLGRERLAPDAARVDPGLGVRPLGAVAFMGLWMLLIWLVPVVLTGLPDVVGVAIGLAVLAGGLGLFFLSLFGLHRQMVTVKAGELALARELYAQAFEPVRAERTLDALERQHRLLGAAGALEQRAQAIHEWPIDEVTFARVITITTSVIAMIIGRLILDPFGL